MNSPVTPLIEFLRPAYAALRVWATAKTEPPPLSRVPIAVFGHSRWKLLLTFVAAAAGFLFSVPTLHAIDVKTFTVNAVVTNSPAAQVAFTWDTQATGGKVYVYRRTLGATGFATWVSRGSTTHPTNAFTDAISAGTRYEYKVFRTNFVSGATYNDSAAYFTVALNAPLDDLHGTVLLVVDNTFTNTLAGPLQQVEMDLAGDGWTVQRINIARHSTTAIVPELRAAIQAAYTADPAQVKALYLFGHPPIAHSGNLAPDGHEGTPHATDGYFADVNGSWTDTQTLIGGPTGTNIVNAPGDGMFDQVFFPGALELMTGRVDFGGLTAYRKTEEEYLRDYIHKSHAWRQGHRQFPRRASWDSNYLWTERNGFNAIVGSANVDYNADFLPPLLTTPYLLAADFLDADGTSPFYTDNSYRFIFGLNFGSHKQKWSWSNNAMRGLLTGADWGLTCAWGARPAWFFHQMQTGAPVGYSALRTQNNTGNAPNLDYYPIGDYSYMDGYVSINLMGDPTLRFHPILPPTGAAVSRSNTTAQLTWIASTDPDVTGYHVYRASARLGPYARLTAATVGGAAFADATAPAGIVYYQVRALKLETTATGTYTNISQAAFARLNADGTGNQPPVATATNFITGINQSLLISLTGTDPDGDSLTPIVITNPAFGLLRWNGTQITYEPASDYTGSDTVLCAVSDGVTVSAPATITLTVTNANSIPPDATNYLVARWNFENNLLDTSTTDAVADDGTGFGGPTYDTTGVPMGSAALALNGTSSQYVSVADSSEVDLATNLTIGAWVKLASSTDNSYRMIVSKRATFGDTTGYEFFYHPANNLLTFRSGGGYLSFSLQLTNLDLDTGWHHLAVTASGVVGKFYVDGVLQSAGVSGAAGKPLAGTPPLVIGRRSGTTEYPWNGQLDDVRFYNRALTAAEISAVMSPPLVASTITAGFNGAQQTIQLSFPTGPGQSYTLLESTNLTVWTPVTNWIGSGAVESLSLPINSAPGGRYFRLRSP